MRPIKIAGRAIAALSLALSTAVTAASTHAAPAGPVTLTFGVEFTDAPTINAAKRYLIEPFEKAHPNIKVKLLAQNGPALDRYLKTSLAAGSGPDVFDENGPAWIPPFADAGEVLNLDPYARELGWRKTIVPWAYNSVIYRGHMYSIPAEFEGLYLWYNADLMTKYGWKLPRTYGDLMHLGKTIESKGRQVFGNGFSDCKACWEWWISETMNAGAGNVLTYKVLTGQVPWTDPRVVAAFTNLKQMWDAGFMLNKQATGVSFNDGWGLWGAGRAVLRMEGTWGFSPGLAFTYGKTIKWNIAPLPMWHNNLPYTIPIGIGEVIAINAKTPHPKEAVAFVDWFVSNPKRSASWADKMISTWGPPLNYGPNDYPKAMDPRFKKSITDMTESMRSGHAGYVAWSAWPAKTDAYMWGNMESMLTGKLSVQVYLQGAQDMFNKEKAAGKLPYVPKPAGA